MPTSDGRKAIIYIASDDRAAEFKYACRDVPVTIGSFPGLGKPGYFDALGQSLKRGGQLGIDACVFDQVSVSAAVGAKGLVDALLAYIRDGISDIVTLVVIDAEHVINNRGRTFLNAHKVRVLADIGELGPDFRAAMDARNAADEAGGITYDDHGNRYVNGLADQPDDDQPDAPRQQENPENMRVGTYVNDPFSELKEGNVDSGKVADDSPFEDLVLQDVPDDDDPFGDDDAPVMSMDGMDAPSPSSGDAAGQRDLSGVVDADDVSDFDMYGVNDYPQDGGGQGGDEDIDPFAPMSQADGSSDSVDLFGSWDDDGSGDGGYQSAGDGYGGYASDDGYDGDGRYVSEGYGDANWDGYSGSMDASDMGRLVHEYQNPSYDYSELAAGIQGGGGLFSKLSGGGKPNLGEVDPSMYANSNYIQKVNEENGSYAPPEECKIIAVNSQVGGSGKTTIATMIGAQLTWYFNRDLLMRKTTAQQMRILVLSLNEFDDIAVKGIGYSGKNSIGDEDDGANVAELKRKIEECDGEPEWDDIAHCFAVNPQNYVTYLPSLTLKEKLEGGIDITAEDYKKIITVCKRFFNFIVLDTPDVFFDQRNGLVQFAFNNANVVVLVIQPDLKSTMHMYRFLDGLRAGNGGKLPIDRNRFMLVVNKLIVPGNPYIGYTRGHSIPFKDIANSCGAYFAKIDPVPYTDPLTDTNILFGTDPKVKMAARDVTDDILELIDKNDGTNGYALKRRMGIGR